MGTAIKHDTVLDQVKPSFCNLWHPGTLALAAEHQSARMSKITNDSLTQPGKNALQVNPYGNRERQRLNIIGFGIGMGELKGDF